MKVCSLKTSVGGLPQIEFVHVHEMTYKHVAAKVYNYVENTEKNVSTSGLQVEIRRKEITKRCEVSVGWNIKAPNSLLFTVHSSQDGIVFERWVPLSKAC